jgi:hypothetical protein
VAGSLKTLAKRVRKIDKELPARVSKLTVDTTIRLVSDLASERTPVDTSQALSNWQVSYGFRPPSFLPPYVEGSRGSTRNASAKATISIAKYSLEGRKAGQVIYLTNNAPYIVDLARGSSKQAPSGWVEASVLRAKKFVGSIKSRVLRGL